MRTSPTAYASSSTNMSRGSRSQVLCRPPTSRPPRKPATRLLRTSTPSSEWELRQRSSRLRQTPRGNSSRRDTALCSLLVRSSARPTARSRRPRGLRAREGDERQPADEVAADGEPEIREQVADAELK